MIFLIVYNTKTAASVELREYDNAKRSEATEDLQRVQAERLHELDHVEVVLFEAPSRATLEQTHSRYFKTLAELGSNLTEAAKNPVEKIA